MLSLYELWLGLGLGYMVNFRWENYTINGKNLINLYKDEKQKNVHFIFE